MTPWILVGIALWFAGVFPLAALFGRAFAVRPDEAPWTHPSEVIRASV